MQGSHKRQAIRELDDLFEKGIAPLGDAALLARFVADRDDSAFEALVVRHGPMVLGVCRRRLGRAPEVDDAFQATFLVLARKAATLRDPERLGPWLHGVATRVAAKARTRAARDRHEPLVEVGTGEPPAQEWSDLLPIVDAELGRLSAKHRDVLVLCLLEGASAEEASRRLGCPVGTVKSRLARGREALRARLVGRGIAPAAALAAVSAGEAFASQVSLMLTRATLATIARPAIAPGLAALIRGVTPSMLSKSIVGATVLAGGVALAGLGTTTWMRPSRAQDGAPEVPARVERSPQERQTNNIKQILLAFHNYAQVNGHFPALATYGADGQPKLSWRVALLPYLDQDGLYQEFHQDEPWDSPHNKALIDRMPYVFQTPEVPVPPGRTRLQGFAGKGALFEGTQGIAFPQITDGTSNTVLIAVAREAIPWTKPGDLPFVPGRPITGLDESSPLGVPFGIADGSVRRIRKSSLPMLPMLVTRDGSEIIDWSVFTTDGEAAIVDPTRPRTMPPAGPTSTISVPTAEGGLVVVGASTPKPLPPTAGGAPGPGGPTVRVDRGGMPPMMPGMGPPTVVIGTATTPEALEERLRRVEEKLDRVLRKLDAIAPDAGSAR